MFSAANLIKRCASQGKGTTWSTLKIKNVPCKCFSAGTPTFQQPSQRKEGGSSALAESKSVGGSEVSTATAFQTVKETTVTAANIGVILFGVGVAGSILYVVFQEFFSKNSPSNIYTQALNDCKRNQSLKDHLGEPIKGYGEANSRGRRKNISHSLYKSEGRKHMLLQFYLQGSRKKGTVYVDMRENEKGNFERNLFVVELDDLLQTRIILEDNRLNESNNNIDSLQILN